MRHDRVYSSWLGTAVLVLIAWLAMGVQDGPPPAQTPAQQLPNVPSIVEETPEGPLSGRVVVVDPGHGGSNRNLGDFGTEGVGPAPEKDNVLAVGLLLRDMLADAGATVVMTRDSDVNPATGTRFELQAYGQLLARVETARQSDADAMVSIHNDWHPDPGITGTTTYYFHPHSVALAEYVQQGVVEKRRSFNHGVKQNGFMVVRDVPMPAILVELGYLSNPAEARSLASEAGRLAAAEGIFSGLIKYFS